MKYYKWVLKASKKRKIHEFYEKRINNLLAVNEEFLNTYKEQMKENNVLIKERDNMQRDLIYSRELQNHQHNIKIDKIYKSFEKIMEETGSLMKEIYKSQMDKLFGQLKQLELETPSSSSSSVPSSLSQEQLEQNTPITIRNTKYSLSAKERSDYRIQCLDKMNSQFQDLSLIQEVEKTDTPESLQIKTEPEDVSDTDCHNLTRYSLEDEYSISNKSSSYLGTPSIYKFEPHSVIEINDSLNSLLEGFTEEKVTNITPKRRSVFSSRYSSFNIVRSPALKASIASPKVKSKTKSKPKAKVPKTRPKSKRQAAKKAEKDKENKTESETESEIRVEETDESECVAIKPKVKRKRGRPKKIKEVQEELNKSFIELFEQ